MLQLRKFKEKGIILQRNYFRIWDLTLKVIVRFNNQMEEVNVKKTYIFNNVVEYANSFCRYKGY